MIFRLFPFSGICFSSLKIDLTWFPLPKQIRQELPEKVWEAITAHRTCHSWREFSDGCQCPFQRTPDTHLTKWWRDGALEQLEHIPTWHLAFKLIGELGKGTHFVLKSSSDSLFIYIYIYMYIYIYIYMQILIGRASCSGPKLSMIIRDKYRPQILKLYVGNHLKWPVPR